MFEKIFHDSTSKKWVQIDKWLKNNANDIFNALNKPAKENEIAKVSELINLTLPNDFKKLYLVHNGLDDSKMANLFYGFTFNSIKKIINDINLFSTLKNNNETLRYADKGINNTYIFSNNRIPIGSDSSHCFICLDLNPSHEGTYGQIILLDTEYNIALLLASSISELLSIFVNDLKNNKYYLAEDALEDEVEWLTPIDEIDVNNWWKISRWSHVKRF